MLVTRCICHQISFRALRDIAERDRADLPALQAKTACGTGCGMCKPYIEVMLATGLTELPVMSEEECARVVRASRPR